MIIVLKPGTRPAQIEEVLAALEELGLRGRALTGPEKTVVHVVAGPATTAARLLKMDRVQAIVRTSGPRIRREGRRFYPYHFLNWGAAGLVVLGVLVFLAGWFPPGLGAPIDVRRPATDLQVPWYLRAPAAYLDLFPERLAWAGALSLCLLVACVVLLPVLDRTRGEGIRRRWPVLAAGLLVVLAALILSLGEGSG